MSKNNEDQFKQKLRYLYEDMQIDYESKYHISFKEWIEGYIPIHNVYNTCKDVTSEQSVRFMDDLFSLLAIAEPVSDNFTIAIADTKNLNMYFATIFHNKTGLAVKMGVKDSTSLTIMHSELLPVQHLYSESIRYMKYATADDDKLSVMMLDTLFSAILSIIQLCLQNSKQP